MNELSFTHIKKKHQANPICSDFYPQMFVLSVSFRQTKANQAKGKKLYCKSNQLTEIENNNNQQQQQLSLSVYFTFDYLHFLL